MFHTRILPFLCFVLSCSLSGQEISSFIHVDQFGYLPEADKVAVLSTPEVGFNAGESYDFPTQLELRNATTDAVVFSGAPTIWNSGAVHGQSGDKGYWFDFSSYTTPGTYYLYDAENDERSAEFVISDEVYNEVFRAAGRMFYYNRCNSTKVLPYAEANWTDGMSFTNALQDANCRYINDPNNASLEKDLTGGWFDAGDYNKYVTFASAPLHNLLWAYKENPDVFGDDWDIPESGNGIPDIIDEIKWELDWMLKMNNADGTTHIKMGSQNYAENVASPPSANTDQRFYGPTCTSASIAAAGVFAHAAKVLADFPAYSSYVTLLETRAVASWNYVLPLLNSDQLEENCDDISIVAGDADRDAAEQREEAITAAIHLFDLTGTDSYHTYVVSNAGTTEPLQTNFWSGYKMPLNDALLHYTTLNNSDATLKSTILTSITTTSSNNWNDFFGFSADDLYRAFMPDWAYHWGSNLPKAGFGVLNTLLVNYGINTGSHADYTKKMAEQLHYFHGVNPMGLVYLSNMYDLGGDRCVNEIYHTWFANGTDYDHSLNSLYGPAPGYVSGGANANFTVTTLTPPAGQPDQKSYLDFNDNFPMNSWEISEPAIYYQAFYLRLLANSATESAAPLAVELMGFRATLNDQKQVLLSWETSLEENHDYFEIQRSGDLERFTALDQISGLGDSYTQQAYAVIDAQPLSGTSYYRLKEVDRSGRFTYSDIVSVDFISDFEAIDISPNPADQFTIISGVSKEHQIDLLDTNGKILQSLSRMEGNARLDVSSLTPGAYLVRIVNLRTQAIVLRKIVKR